MSAKTSRNTVRSRVGREATIRDVASRAGVSVATVSRVLNGKKVVREETMRGVREAAQSLRYVPNVAARSLSAGSSHTIGVLLPDVHGEFFSEVIRGIDGAARASRYHILVSGWHSDTGEMLEVLNAMRGRVDGILLMAPDVAVAATRDHLAGDLPLVVLNSADKEHDTITIDNYGGAQAMMQHLLQLGHSRIAFVKGPKQNLDAKERLRGYRQAMRLCGQPGMELEGDFSEESGRQAALKIAAMPSLPDAVFCANDSMAAGLISSLSERDVDVPGEIAVVGFDDIPVARLIHPSLTTVHIDIADFGRRAFSLLLRSLASPGAERHSEAVATSLVIRKSCGASHGHDRNQRELSQSGRKK